MIEVVPPERVYLTTDCGLRPLAADGREDEAQGARRRCADRARGARQCTAGDLRNSRHARVDTDLPTRSERTGAMSIASRGASDGESTGSSGSTSRGCVGSGSSGRGPRLPHPISARCCSSTRTTSATSRARTSANGRGTRTPASSCSAATADPILWDFGSAARSHQLYAPWLPESSWRAGVTSMRGAMPVETGVPDAMAAHDRRRAARARARGRAGRDRHERHGHAGCAAPGRHPHHRRAARDARARKIKTEDEKALLDHAAAIVDGVYERIYELLRPGVREHEIVADAMRYLPSSRARSRSRRSTPSRATAATPTRTCSPTA